MEPEQPKNGLAPRDGFQIFIALAQVHAWCLLPFIRRGQGCDQPGIFGVVAFFGMVLYAFEMRSLATLRYFQCWVVAMVIMRLRMDRSQHSLYTGRPYLDLLLGWIKPHRRETVARMLEPLACLLIGIGLQGYDKALGNLILAGFFSLNVLEGLHRALARRRRIMINDAQVMGREF